MARPQGRPKRSRPFVSNESDELIRVIRSYQERQLPDPFREVYGVGSDGIRIVEPPFNPNALVRLPRESNILASCIDAMATNIEGHGGAIAYIGKRGEEDSELSRYERQVLADFTARPNPTSSLLTLLDRRRRDIETLGYGCVEVVRDRAGNVTMVQHIPAHTVRIAVVEEDPVEVTTTMPRNGRRVTVVHKRRFRRFVQIVGQRRVYFKEFGDPRPIDPNTGLVNESLTVDEIASEIYFSALYAQDSPYGYPRWFGQITSVMGSRQAELTNLDFFSKNAIPAMAILVSGGMLTQASIEEIESKFSAAIGRQAMNRVLVLEAEGDSSAASLNGQIPQPKVSIETLQKERQGDALFQQYDLFNREKIRSAFRLPPLFLGLADDYNHATARSGFQVAESQVFAPERRKTEEMLREILGVGEYWEYRFRPPVLSDPTDVIRGVQTFRNVGAISANTAIELANSYFDLDIPKVEEPWADLPYSIVETLGRHGLLRGGFESVTKDPASSLPIPQERPSEVNSPNDFVPDTGLNDLGE